MLSHVQTSDKEVCGLLGGRANRVHLVLPVENGLHSAERYRMEPEAQWKAMRAIEDAGLELIGIYHSHPTGTPEPSATDVAEAAYPGVVNVIWAPGSAGWVARAFLIEGGGWREIAIAGRHHDATRGEAAP
jgi:proteasome lid subunit RPN8/RPN11